MASIYELCDIPRLSLEQRRYELKKYQDQTFDEALEKMQAIGKVMVVRPTGFGKTYMLAKIAGHYIEKQSRKKVLYLYPNNIIRDDVLENPEYGSWGVSRDTVDFIHYNTLAKRCQELGEERFYKIFQSRYSIAILDEVHMAGAEGFKELYEILKSLFSAQSIHIIGATATPIRTDDWDVLGNIFNNSQVFNFDLADAILAGIMKPFIHEYTSLAIEDYMGSVLSGFMKGKRQDDRYNEEYMRAELSKVVQEIDGVPGFMFNMFKHTGRRLEWPASFRFINFFRNIHDLIQRGPIVEGWYKELFNKIYKDPSYRAEQPFKLKVIYVATKSISSALDDPTSLRDLATQSGGKYVRTSKELLDEVGEDPYTVYLIFNINMLTMGWHVPNITGVAFLRPTKSDVMYQQQRGRALSVKDEYPAMIFDFVNNARLGEERERFESNQERKNVFRDLLGMGNKTSDKKEKLLDCLMRSRIESTTRVLDFLKKIKTSPDEERIIWLYTNREAPICMIAADLGRTCSEVVEVLRKNKIQLLPEDWVFKYFLNSGQEGLAKFLYGKKPAQYAKEVQQVQSTLLDIIEGQKTGV